MKRIGVVAWLGLFVFLYSHSAFAQEPPPEKGAARPSALLKVTVVLNEFEGTKKIASLPYSFYVNSDDPTSNGQRTSQVRVGLRVPIRTGGSTSVSTQFTYMDIGTSMDCRVNALSEGRFMLVFSVERTYLYELSQGSSKPEGTVPPESLAITGNPVIGRFNSSYDLQVRDGQTIEATSTTDPVSGRVLKIEVTVNVVK